MAVTPNYGWPVPVATDYVKDGWEAISDLGNAIDTTVAGLGSSAFTLVSTSSFTAQSTASINNVFSADYAHYKIIFNGTSSADVSLNMRMRVAGADNTSANYGWAQLNWRQSASSGISTTSGLDTVFTIGAVYSTGGRKAALTLDIFNPFATDNTNYVGFCSHYNGSYHYGDVLTGGMSVTTSYTGFSLIPSSGTITGTVSVYGMTV